MSYGTSIYKFPAGGAIHAAPLSDVASKDEDKDGAEPSESSDVRNDAGGLGAGGGDGGPGGGGDGGGGAGSGGGKAQHAVLGITRSGAGSVAVFGDSNCLDASHKVRAARPREAGRAGPCLGLGFGIWDLGSSMTDMLGPPRRPPRCGAGAGT